MAQRYFGYVAIPTSPKSKFFGHRLECTSHSDDTADVMNPSGKKHIKITVSRTDVNVLAELPLNDIY